MEDFVPIAERLVAECRKWGHPLECDALMREAAKRIGELEKASREWSHEAMAYKQHVDEVGDKNIALLSRIEELERGS